MLFFEPVSAAATVLAIVLALFVVHTQRRPAAKAAAAAQPVAAGHEDAGGKCELASNPIPNPFPFWR